MKKLLAKIFDKFVEIMSYPTEDERVAQAMMSYDSFRVAPEPQVRDRRKINDEATMALRAGDAFMSYSGRPTATVYDGERSVYVVYGATLASATRRAQQLVNALDGARRL